jgi:hypothetical protein
MAEPMPRTELGETHWTPAERAEFMRRRRGRNVALLVALGGVCLVIYAIVIVKLHEYGTMW